MRDDCHHQIPFRETLPAFHAVKKYINYSAASALVGPKPRTVLLEPCPLNLSPIAPCPSPTASRLSPLSLLEQS
jgi:hypothetical protein